MFTNLADGPDLTAAERVSGVIGTTDYPSITRKRVVAPGVALIGDAAACASLLAGEGAGLAMIEAYVLAGEIHRANGNFQRAFASYEGRLRRFVTAKQQSALRFRSFFAPRSALALAVRNFSVNCLSHPFFAKRFVTRSIQDTFELPSYLTS